MTGRRALVALLLLVVVAGLGLRVLALTGKNYLDHDEAISYLAATCHQADWERMRIGGLAPFGTWAPAAAWQSFLEADRSWCLGTIATGLADHDIHPPLYFWLLHVAVLVLGTHLWTGPVLNLAVYALGALALFGLARRVLADPRLALLVTAAWSFSPAVVRVFAEARQYELLAALTIAFALLCVRVVDHPRPPRARDLGLLAVVAGAGALTHYYFALVAAGGAAFLARRLLLGHRRALALALGAMLAGYLAFAALHPGFLESFGREQDQAEDFAAHAVGVRVERVARALAGFVVPTELLERPAAAWAVLALLAAGGAISGWVARRARAAPGRGGPSGGIGADAGAAPVGGAASADAPAPAGPRPPARGAAAWFLAATAGGTLLLYLAFVSHGLAMGGKYLASAWPFVAFLPAFAVSALAPRARAAAATAVCAVLLVAGAVGAVLLYRGPDRPVAPDRVVAGRHAILVDTVRRGVLPQVLWDVPPGMPVFAADQGWLLANERRWLGRLEPPALYVSDLRYGDPAARLRLVGQIARRHRVRDTDATLGVDGEAFPVGRGAARGRR